MDALTAIVIGVVVIAIIAAVLKLTGSLPAKAAQKKYDLKNRGEARYAQEIADRESGKGFYADDSGHADRGADESPRRADGEKGRPEWIDPHSPHGAEVRPAPEDVETYDVPAKGAVWPKMEQYTAEPASEYDTSKPAERGVPQMIMSMDGRAAGPVPADDDIEHWAPANEDVAEPPSERGWPQRVVPASEKLGMVFAAQEDVEHWRAADEEQSGPPSERGRGQWIGPKHAKAMQQVWPAPEDVDHFAPGQIAPATEGGVRDALSPAAFSGMLF